MYNNLADVEELYEKKKKLDTIEAKNKNIEGELSGSKSGG